MRTNRAIAALTSAVAEAAGVTEEDLVSRCRRSDLVQARFMLWYLARTALGWGTPAIGLKFGLYDHTTVQHGIRRMDQMMREGHPATLVLERAVAIFNRRMEAS